jgi:hypothetical protein
VEQATFKPTSPKLDKNVVLSLWTQEKLVDCRLDQARKDVPSGQVLSESGKIIDLPAVSISLQQKNIPTRRCAFARNAWEAN